MAVMVIVHGERVPYFNSIVGILSKILIAASQAMPFFVVIPFFVV